MNIAIIRNADIHAPAPLGRANILIVNDRIAAIGPHVELPPWAGDAADPVDVDAAGCLTTPGLMDAHVHITGGGGEAGFHTQVPPLPLSVPVTGGVTTIGGLLGTDGITRHVDNVLAKACSLEEEGLSTFIMTGGYPLPSPTITGSVQRDFACDRSALRPGLGLGPPGNSGGLSLSGPAPHRHPYQPLAVRL